MVELAGLGKAHAGGDWRGFLDEIKKEWDAALAATEDGSEERRHLYQGLVGPRARQES
ncbi:hypothetical protein [Streptomyces sp. NPDC005799]|uniref:hypothetical protein n=1 Tax=Streptomyces sp. NPDC005799 TaxID=3154678 RepID=UPI0033C572F7